MSVSLLYLFYVNILDVSASCPVFVLETVLIGFLCIFCVLCYDYLGISIGLQSSSKIEICNSFRLRVLLCNAICLSTSDIVIFKNLNKLN